MVFGAENNKGVRFFGNTLKEAEDKARASERVFLNEKFTPENNNVKIVKEEVVVKEKLSMEEVIVKEKLSREEIFKWVKAEQVDWLRERNITPARYEKDRVEQIFKNQ